jgi:pimeloyl-ACP methyl ester carboxylesterase
MRIATRVGLHLLDWLYAAAGEVGHLVRPGAAGRYARGTLDPVLLLPGVYETWEFLRPVADRLAALGHPIHVVPGFRYNSATIPSQAALALAYLVEHDLDRVVLMAHSKGGLIGKHMMVRGEGSARIGRLIAVNTPFGGSPYARWAPGRTLREFAVGGTTLSALALELTANSRIASVYSADDLLIPGGSELAGAVNVELPLVGHFRPLSSALLLETVESLLGHPPEETPR